MDGRDLESSARMFAHIARLRQLATQNGPRRDSVPNWRIARSRAVLLGGFVKRTAAGPRWTGRVELMWEKLAEPQHWAQPKRIFVNSMSDLFHESLSEDEIGHVFKTMYHVNWHTYQVLTKRSVRMKELMPRVMTTFGHMKHVWLGVSIEDRVNKARIYDLQETWAGLRFLSIEPLLEDVGTLDLKGIGWVIVGGESGPGSRPFRLEWARAIMQQCREACVPFFFKQAGGCPIVDYYADDDLREWALAGCYDVYNWIVVE